MSRKYTFAIKVGDETFQAEGFDSFDEAIKVVEKAVYDRRMSSGKEKSSLPSTAVGGSKVLNK